MSTMSPWLRFGLPLGNALLLVALLDSVILIINVIKDMGVGIYYSLSEADANKPIDIPELIFLTTLAILKMIANIVFLWVGTIFKGSFRMLQAWIVATIIFFLAIIGNLIFESATGHHNVPHLTYVILVFTITCLYQLIIGVVSLNTLRANDYDALQPVGKGALYVWEYFLNDLQSAVKFFLVSEIVIDVYFLVTRQFLREIFGVVLWGYEGEGMNINDLNSSMAPIVIEQLVLKVIRVLLNAVGLAMVIKEKREAFRLWCLVSLVIVMISTFLFVVITINWRGQDLISTLGFFLLFPGHLLFRCIVLYFCLRYTRVNFSSMVL